MPTHAPAARSPATRAGRGCRARRSARPERSPSLTTSATCNARPGEKSATPLPGPDLGLTGGGGGGEYAAENSLFVTPGSTLTIHDRPGGSGHATIVTGGGVPVIATAGGDAADPDQTFTVTGGTAGTGSTNGTHLNGGGSSFTATTGGGGGSSGGTSAADGNGATGDVGGGAGTAGGRGCWRGPQRRRFRLAGHGRQRRGRPVILAVASSLAAARAAESAAPLTAASTLAATGNAARAAQLAVSSSLSAGGLISSALAVLEATAGYRGSGDRRRRDAGRARGPGRHGRMPGAVSVADHDT